MTITTLKSMPYAQAKVQIENDEISLISYATTVAVIKEGWLQVNGLYSATTRRHISAFMREYTPFDYQMAKQICNDNSLLNIITGEIREI